MMIEYYYSHETPTSSGTKAKNRNVSRASLLRAVPWRGLLPGGVGRPPQLSLSGPRPDVHSESSTGILPKAPLSPRRLCSLLSEKELTALCAGCHHGEHSSHCNSAPWSLRPAPAALACLPAPRQGAEGTPAPGLGKEHNYAVWQLMGCSHRHCEDLHGPPCSIHCWEDAQFAESIRECGA